MDFLWAVKAMKEGKKVIRSSLIKNDMKPIYFEEISGQLVFNDGNPFYINKNHFDATDWELIEEPKTLSDKVKKEIDGNILLSNPPQNSFKNIYEEEDVRETIQKIKKRIKTMVWSKPEDIFEWVNRFIDEEVGEQLK